MPQTPKLTLSLAKPDNLNHAIKLPHCREILIEHRDLARVGFLDSEGCLALARAAREHGLRTVLVWDLLVSDNQLLAGAALVRGLDLTLFDAIRVQDAGVARYTAECFPGLPRQLVLETGNHNLPGIVTWIASIQPERVVLSNELPMSLVRQIRAAVSVELEYIALGRLLIFYTPRKLVSPVSTLLDEAPETIQRFITSEEDEGHANKHYPLVENQHGTFMYYEKDLFLVPYLAEMADAGIDYARLDAKFFDDTALLPALKAYLETAVDENLAAVKALLGPRLSRGFFKSNRTDKQFKRLKNPFLAVREDAAYLGEVLETKKKQYTAIKSAQAFAVGDKIHIQNPEGKITATTIQQIRDSAGNPREQAAQPGIWVVNHIRGASAGSKLYLGSGEPT
ncbi:U32 family peptidase C-terminal domain-containing protein [Acanthopleuribacter pedis]|uniref:U32 family peptidase C-terminal domain-containing protein n=1 Tax=Acanthopleuribacter pedis TaxID=442870 RepID=A0A8J7QLD4_9BACT|nr:U32 family peptidase C-terminal domain-containing protein [Acanthopleuribacter pedis]MBO1320393.1 U32 family peptidase C-terminal domain-containing protein [Acanthopleuribacter pedis]